jgi:hypothetical protein
MSISISISMAGVICLKRRGEWLPPLIPQAERKNTTPTIPTILKNLGMRLQIK